VWHTTSGQIRDSVHVSDGGQMLICISSTVFGRVALATFRHPPASRAFAAQTGGRSGLREQDTVADTAAPDIVSDQVASGAAASPGLATLAGG
jgi:hypothetical protein